MNIYDKKDEKTAMKEEYVAGRISVEEYSKWLNSKAMDQMSQNLAKKNQINPNSAFRNKKFHETLSNKEVKIEVVKRPLPLDKSKYKWMEHDNDDDDDVPF